MTSPKEAFDKAREDFGNDLMKQADQAFDAAWKLSLDPPTYSLLDRSIKLDIPTVVQTLSTCFDNPPDEDQVKRWVASGWLPNVGDEGDIRLPPYAFDRITLIHHLITEGWSAQEITACCEWEEHSIDCIACDELAYDDDDLSTLIADTKVWMHILEQDVDLSHVKITKDQLTRRLHTFQKYQRTGIPPKKAYVIAKAAHRVRFINEMQRGMLFGIDRGKAMAGYSPWIQGGSQLEQDGWKPTEINWPITIQMMLPMAESPIRTRIPGFLIEGESVVPTKTMPPTVYKEQWQHYDLDTYLAEMAKITGTRRCLECSAELSDAKSDRKLYCDERCRNRAKQKRLRERNPEAAIAAQQRYWGADD